MLKKSIGGLSFLFTIFVMVIFPVGFETASAVSPGGFLNCDGVDCSACNLVYTANVIIVWLFGIIFMIFAVLMAIAGFGLVTSGGNQAALESAKNKFVNAIIGLIIVMGAWLFVDTVMKGLLSGGTGEISGYGPWSDVECYIQISPKEYIREGSGPDIHSVDSEVSPPTVTAGEYTHDQAVNQLSGKDINISSSGNCSDPTNRKCTSLAGIKESTIQRVIELQENIGDTVYITGGTETGHANGTYSHGEGYKVDLRTTSSVNDYIMENYTQVSDSKWKDEYGNIYYRHGPVDHWDVTITN